MQFRLIGMSWVMGFLAFLLNVMFLSISKSADFNLVNEPLVRCTVELTGVIENGDAQTLRELISQPQNQYDWKPFENSQRICLNSPGGSFDEALKIATLINEKLFGTIVRRDERCLSACGIIFLAGSYWPEGDTSVVDRHIHANAKLGFHAPSLNIEDPSYVDWQMVTDAYEVAIESMAKLQEKASVWRIKDSLLFNMLSTPPSRFLTIDTVGKAIRWNVGVFGTVIPEKLGALQMQLACEAALEATFDNNNQYGFLSSVESEIKDYDKNGHIALNRSEQQGIEIYTGKRTGYLQEALSNCLFRYDVKLVEDSLYPNFRPTTVQIEPDSIYVSLPAISLYPNETKLGSIARLDDNIIESVRFIDDSAGPGVIKKNGMCRIVSNRKLIDAELCSHTVESGRLVYTWPSGSRTVVRESNGKYEINGSPARFIQDGKSGNNQELGLCLLNTKSQNLFCFYEYTGE